MKVVLVTGGFDPIHSGHLSYLRAAKELGDKLIVGVNSDEWLTRKKGKPFMDLEERVRIVQALEMVDYTVKFIDDDDSSRNAIKQVRQTFPDSQIIFANGGDREKTNIPEMDYEDDNLEFVFGVGGSNKINSSSTILNEWKSPKTDRSWGYYRVLHNDGPETKVKELVVEPGQSLSLQKHSQRSEHWFVTNGRIHLKYGYDSKNLKEKEFIRHEIVNIPVNQWHQLVNKSDYPAKVVEIQYGTNCIESDIERYK